MSFRTPAETVQAYTDAIYRDRQATDAPAFMADPSIRHDVDGRTTILTHADVLDRVTRIIRDFPTLEMPTTILVADDRGVAMLWDSVQRNHDGDELRYCGIEIFRVEAGLITEVWNQPISPGHWG